MYIVSNGIKTAVILQDHDPISPRDKDYQENLCKMICWHRRYNLGDEHDFDDPHGFAEHLASEHLDIKDVFRGIRDDLVEGYQLAEVENLLCNYKEYGPCYNLQVYSDLHGDEGWHGTDWFVTKDFELITSGGQVLEDLYDSFTTRDLLKLLDHSDKVAIKTLYLYDHSGISISTGSFVGRAPHADWDSGPIGFVYLDKETVMKNMAMPKETLRIARVIPLDERNTISFGVSTEFDPMDAGDFLKKRGFERVEKAEHIRNLNSACLSRESSSVLDETLVNSGHVFKKNHKLYTLNSASRENGLQLVEVAVFNPDLQPMTAEAWKAAAMREIEADVQEYDNYLNGEVYGFQCFEGLDEVDSCWGFNPINERIEDLMNDELRGWFGSKMNFEYVLEDKFDIEEFFDKNDFPELRQQIYEDVKSFITFEEETSKIYPFEVSADNLLANQDGILDDIVSDLYEMHVELTGEDIYSAIQEHAGISRQLQPKLTAKDLKPGKEYTADELMDMIHKKRSLNALIAEAEARAKNLSPGHDPKDRGPIL